jgi:ubiquitin C-terminal hydrolase
VKPKLTGVKLHRAFHRSIVSETFHGFVKKKVKFECGHRQNGIESFVSWQFDMPKADGVVTFWKCRELWLKKKQLDGELCEECESVRSGRWKLRIWTFPAVPAVQFKQFEEDADGRIQKNGTQVEFPRKFKAEFETDPEAKPATYRMFAVIVLEYGGEGGRYSTFVSNQKHPRLWCRVGDTEVETVGQGGTTVPNAYLLFYERCARDGKEGDN